MNNNKNTRCNMKERKDIEEKYKWNLCDIYKTKEDLFKDFEFYKERTKLIENYKGKLNNKETFLEYLHLDDELDYLSGKIFLYVFLLRDLDISNSENVELMDTVSTFQNKISALTSFVEPEILQFNNEYLEDIYKDDRFSNYVLSIKDIIKNKEHILDDKTEELLARVGEFAGGFSEVYDNIESVDIKFEPFTHNGKKYELTHGTYGLYRESPDREIRRMSYENMYKAFKALSNSIATNYIYNVKTDWFYTKEHKYNSCLDAEFNARNLSENVYHNLVKNVENNLPVIHKYFKLLKDHSGLADFTVYDTGAPLVQDFKPEFDVETAKGLALKALNVLGQDYINVLTECFENNWIDYYETENKATGGYEIAVYGVHPYILLNYQPNYNSLSTLVHELGHACHSYYSNKHNPIATADYNMFLAEIPSTTNELLLLKYMITNAKDNKEKLYYLNKFVNDFYATVFTQTMYSKFELFAHNTIENEKSLSKDLLCNYYGNLIKDFYGENVKEHEYSKYAWLRIPHFYRCYYVYKYATSYAVSSYIANKLFNGEDNMLEKYKQFISSGSKMYPADILKLVDVDLTQNDVYDVAFSELKWAIDEIEKLL